MNRFAASLIQNCAAIATSTLVALTPLYTLATPTSNQSNDSDWLGNSTILLANSSFTGETSDDSAYQSALTTLNTFESYGLSLRAANGEFYPTASMQRQEFATAHMAMLDYIFQQVEQYSAIYNEQCDVFAARIDRLNEATYALEAEATYIFSAIDEAYQLQLESTSSSDLPASAPSTPLPDTATKLRSQLPLLNLAAQPTNVRSQIRYSAAAAKQSDSASYAEWEEYWNHIERIHDLFLPLEHLADPGQTAYIQAPLTHSEFVETVVQYIETMRESSMIVPYLSNASRDRLIVGIEPVLAHLEAQFAAVEADLQALAALVDNSTKVVEPQRTLQSLQPQNSIHFTALNTPYKTTLQSLPSSTPLYRPVQFSTLLAQYVQRIKSITEVTDVSPNDSYYEDLERLIYHGLDFTFADGTFRGDQVLTRKEYVLYLGRTTDRLLESFSLAGDCSFHEYGGAINTGNANSILSQLEHQIDLRQAALERDMH